MMLHAAFRSLARKGTAGLCALALAGFAWNGAAFAQPAAQPAAPPAKAAAATTATMAAPPAAAADPFRDRVNKSQRHLEWIPIKSGDRTLQTFVAYPEVKDKAPVIILIHEIFGMSSWVESLSDELAEAGFIVVAPDLLSGMAPGGGRTADFVDASGIRSAIGKLTSDGVATDMDAVFAYAKTIPSGNGKIAVAGFCWGGGHSFNYATKQKDLAAAFVFYGTPPSSDDALKAINCPVYGFYGGMDNRVTSTVDPTKERMKAAGKTYEPVVYEGAGHGFMRSGETAEAGTPNRKGRDAGFARMVEILKKLQ